MNLPVTDDSKKYYLGTLLKVGIILALVGGGGCISHMTPGPETRLTAHSIPPVEYVPPRPPEVSDLKGRLFTPTPTGSPSLSPTNGEAHLLWLDGAEVVAPSPFDDRIAYVRANELRISSIDGNSQTKTLIVAPVGQISWARDSLVIVSNQSSGAAASDARSQIYWAKSPDWAPQAILPDSLIGHVYLSPIGDNVAYVAVDTKTHLTDLKILNIKSNSISVVVSSRIIHDISWSNDGRRLIYSTTIQNTQPAVAHAIAFNLDSNRSIELGDLAIEGGRGYLAFRDHEPFYINYRSFNNSAILVSCGVVRGACISREVWHGEPNSGYWGNVMVEQTRGHLLAVETHARQWGQSDPVVSIIDVRAADTSAKIRSFNGAGVGWLGGPQRFIGRKGNVERTYWVIAPVDGGTFGAQDH